MHQRVGVNQFHRASCGECFGRFTAARGIRHQHESRPQALAGAEHGVAHRFGEFRWAAVAERERARQSSIDRVRPKGGRNRARRRGDGHRCNRDGASCQGETHSLRLQFPNSEVYGEINSRDRTGPQPSARPKSFAHNEIIAPPLNPSF